MPTSPLPGSIFLILPIWLCSFCSDVLRDSQPSTCGGKKNFYDERHMNADGNWKNTSCVAKSLPLLLLHRLIFPSRRRKVVAQPFFTCQPPWQSISSVRLQIFNPTTFVLICCVITRDIFHYINCSSTRRWETPKKRERRKQFSSHQSNFPSLEANEMAKLFMLAWIAFWRQTWEKYKEFRFRGRLRGVCSEFPWPFDLCLGLEMRDETWLLWWVQHKPRNFTPAHARLLSPAKGSEIPSELQLSGGQ